ncbi:hypothetical protein RND71_015768 [Anisodus tanguticus]|uniref:Uncharacterized protein n=1 Tax=Anisodus tanguticus TaxID=243964 RepID=A0AAE1S6H1_9SOLA|nr:hypothetical protein RND71_015768 [Anisodus tanguticus]
MSFAPAGARSSRGSREGKRMLHTARDDKERASSIDEQRIDGALGIALFFSPFLSASSDPFVRNFFVCLEPLANQICSTRSYIAIHPPCIYDGDIAGAMGFGLYRSKMMNGIVALHSPPMRKDAAEKNGTLVSLYWMRRIPYNKRALYPQIQICGRKMLSLLYCYVAIEALLILLRRCFFALSSLWTGALVDTGRERAKRVVRNGKKDTTTSPLCWTTGANTVVSTGTGNQFEFGS